MSFAHGFPPISSPDARLLILGSMPGKASLAAGRYYAHPRNQFWRLMEALLDIPADLPYPERCRRLARQGVALWDVLKTCTRTGSLDSAIETSTIVPNDFSEFLSGHSSIEAVFFNGAKAEEIFLRYVKPALADDFRELPLRRLPSTSPANASLGFDDKLDHWRKLREHLPPRP